MSFSAADSESRSTLRSFDPERRSRKRRNKQSGEASHDEAKVSEDALREAALAYLDQRDASIEQVRRVLLRRVKRFAPPEVQQVARERIEGILCRFRESRLLDDARFAATLAGSMRRRGDSSAKIRLKLQNRGISLERIQEALEADDEWDDQQSALLYAQKKRLSQRYDLEDPKQRQKALASLARQGFSFDIARRALGL